MRIRKRNRGRKEGNKAKEGNIKLLRKKKPIKPGRKILDRCVCVCSVVSDSLQPHGLWSARLLCPWDSPGKSTEMGCHFLLQGVFPTQGSCLPFLLLLHWQADYFTNTRDQNLEPAMCAVSRSTVSGTCQLFIYSISAPNLPFFLYSLKNNSSKVLT